MTDNHKHTQPPHEGPEVYLGQERDGPSSPGDKVTVAAKPAWGDRQGQPDEKWLEEVRNQTPFELRR